MPAGRPSTYNEAIALTICERLTQGESLRAICRDDAMPGLSTVMQWLARHAAFAEQYAHAKTLQTEHMAEELLEIADNESGDPQRDKLRVDTRKWLMGKLKPKKYSERHIVEHSGSIGRDLNTLTDEELAAIATGETTGRADSAGPQTGENSVH